MSSETPTIDVIITANGDRVAVERSLQSVRSQTSPPSAVFLAVSGGLPPVEGEPEHVVRVVRTGPGAARNAAARAGRGALIALLDAGDEWTPLHLQRSVESLRAHPECDIVHGPYAVAGRPVQPVRSGWLLDELFADSLVVDSTAVFRRTVWERIGGFDETLTGSVGHNFWLRAACGHRFGALAEASVSRAAPAACAGPELTAAWHERAEMLYRFYELQGGVDRLDGGAARRVLSRLCFATGRRALAEGNLPLAERLFQGAAYYGRTWRAWCWWRWAAWRRRRQTVAPPVAA